MWHSIFIAVHAATGGLALITGCVALRSGTLLRLYLGSLVGMELFLTLAVAAEWPDMATSGRILFAAFAALGLFMLWRADRARRIAPQAGTGPSARYVEHIGFTLVALLDAFVVVGILDVGAPAWLVVASGVLIAVAGHYAIRYARTRLVGAAKHPVTTGG